MNLTILESPYAGDVDKNVSYARLCLRDSLMRGEHPIASHLLYTQEGVLDDNIPEERSHGIDSGLAWRTVADQTIVYSDLGITKGMKYGIDKAEEEGITVLYRHLLGTSEFAEWQRKWDNKIATKESMQDAIAKFKALPKNETSDKLKALFDKATIKPAKGYKISLYIDGFAGLYQYEVGTLDQAMNHFAAITTTGYRRVNDRGQFEWYSPAQIKFIKIDGEGLDTGYPDKFIRT
jgi:hypothetical protein